MSRPAAALLLLAAGLAAAPLPPLTKTGVAFRHARLAEVDGEHLWEVLVGPRDAQPAGPFRLEFRAPGGELLGAPEGFEALAPEGTLRLPPARLGSLGDRLQVLAWDGADRLVGELTLELPGEVRAPLGAYDLQVSHLASEVTESRQLRLVAALRNLSEDVYPGGWLRVRWTLQDDAGVLQETELLQVEKLWPNDTVEVEWLRPEVPVDQGDWKLWVEVLEGDNDPAGNGLQRDLPVARRAEGRVVTWVERLDVDQEVGNHRDKHRLWASWKVRAVGARDCQLHGRVEGLDQLPESSKVWTSFQEETRTFSARWRQLPTECPGVYPVTLEAGATCGDEAAVPFRETVYLLLRERTCYTP